ncbi:MAG: thioredoxin family protein [Verrucomicrobia bacterium]|jgi:thioredoxin 1|nr:thioredoxin family protein [Verrucomicrobiota bacterium]
MKAPAKILIVGAVAVAVVAAISLKQNKTPATGNAPVQGAVAASSQAAPAAVVTTKLPRLVDLGAGRCIPCKTMKPILGDLKANFASHFITEFIDVWENPDEGKKYGIEMIPTQIFYDAEGQELFRHTGFYGKEAILAKWKELGVDTGDRE